MHETPEKPFDRIRSAPPPIPEDQTAYEQMLGEVIIARAKWLDLLSKKND